MNHNKVTLTEDEKTLRRAIAAQIRPLIDGDSSADGAATRGIVHRIVAEEYGTIPVTTQLGTQPGACLTDDGVRAYNTVMLVLSRVSLLVKSKVINGS